MPRGRRSKLEKMENQKNLQVTFSRRRSELFKEASGLSSLGAHVLLIVFSPTNKAYCFGHPNAERLMQAFLSNGTTEPQTDLTTQYMEAQRDANLREMISRYEELLVQLERAKKRNAELKKKMKEEGSLWCGELDEDQLLLLDDSLNEMQVKMEAGASSETALPLMADCGGPSSRGGEGVDP